MENSPELEKWLTYPLDHAELISREMEAITREIKAIALTYRWPKCDLETTPRE